AGRDAGVIDQQINATVSAERFLYEALAVGRDGNIGPRGDPVSARFADEPQAFFSGARVAGVVDDHGVAQLRQLYGDTAAYASSCAGHQGNGAFIHFCPPGPASLLLSVRPATRSPRRAANLQDRAGRSAACRGG